MYYVRSLKTTLLIELIMILIVIGSCIAIFHLFEDKANKRVCIEQFGTDKIEIINGKLGCITHDNVTQMAR